MSETVIGVQTQSLPTLKVLGIQGAPLNQGGFLIKSERGVMEVQKINNYPLFQEIYGGKKADKYGAYCVEGCFQNLGTSQADIYIKRMLGGDAVTASSSVDNLGANPVYTIQAGRRGDVDPGIWPNGSLGYLMIASSRASATMENGGDTVATDTEVTFETISDYEVGDILDFGSSVIGVVESLDELNNKVILTAQIGAIVTDATVVAVIDRTLKVYRKNLKNGVITLLETFSNITNISTSPHYVNVLVNNIYRGSLNLKITHLTTAEAELPDDLPVVVADDLANIIFLASGTEGTPLTESEQVALLDEMPEAVLVANTETFTETFVDDFEAKCYADDTGKKIAVVTPAKVDTGSVTAMKEWAAKRRETRKKHMLPNRAWIVVDDDPNVGVGEFPKKDIPNVGHIIGFFISEVLSRGFHKVPATKKRALVGVRGIVNPMNDTAVFTPLADLGLNNISESAAGKFYVRSARTPSKSAEFKFINSIFMIIYFKKTFENDPSFGDLENEMDAEGVLSSIRDSMRTFAQAIYKSSTNGGLESGFARFRKSDGTLTTFGDVVKIVADESINDFDDVMGGLAKARFYFMAPSPVERILIGVGLIFQVGGAS